MRKTLTPREHEILQMLADGFDGPEIAERLESSPLTVRTHVQSIRSKLAVRTRAGAVAVGFREEILR